MSLLQNIPLHMMALAGMIGSLEAQDKTGNPPVASPTSSAQVAYAGVNLVEMTEKSRSEAKLEIPSTVGVQVGFVDPSGPSMGLIEEGDIFTRLDDQVLMNVPQFQNLIRMHHPDDTVKITLVRGAEAKVVELKLAGRAAKVATDKSARKQNRTANTPGNSNNQSGIHITINGQTYDIDPTNPNGMQLPGGQVVVIGPNGGLSPEVKQRLEELRARGLQLNPPAAGGAQASAQADGQQSQTITKSFSFSFGSGNGVQAGSVSSSIASDEKGTVSIEEKDGKKHAVIKDPSGKVLFDGDVTTPEQRNGLSKDLRDRLKLVEGGNFSIPGFSPKPAEEAPKKPKPHPQGA